MNLGENIAKIIRRVLLDAAALTYRTRALS